MATRARGSAKASKRHIRRIRGYNPQPEREAAFLEELYRAVRAPLGEMSYPRGRRKLKLELMDENGDRLTLIFEGRLSREKLLQLADLMELYGGAVETQPEEQYIENSKLGKLVRILAKYFPFGYFTSRDAVEAYMTEYREPISLSTASTYLARLADRGHLEKTKTGNLIRYRLAQPRIPRQGERPELRGYGLGLEP